METKVSAAMLLPGKNAIFSFCILYSAALASFAFQLIVALQGTSEIQRSCGIVNRSRGQSQYTNSPS